MDNLVSNRKRKNKKSRQLGSTKSSLSSPTFRPQQHAFPLLGSLVVVFFSFIVIAALTILFRHNVSRWNVWNFCPKCDSCCSKGQHTFSPSSSPHIYKFARFVLVRLSDTTISPTASLCICTSESCTHIDFS